MVDLNQLENDLERVTADLAAAEAELARTRARVEGLRAERDARTRAVASFSPIESSSGEDIASMVKADAIVAVLGRAKPRAMRTAGIVEALHQAGRSN